VTSFPSTIIVGVTGGVGAGKSAAQKICSNLGFPNADVDKFVHKILDGSNFVNSAILERFNSQFNCVPLLENGLIDRKAIAEKTFKFQDFKLFLENLIHPIVKKESADWICFQKNNPSKCAFIFVPLLFESGMDKMVDLSINISATVKIRTNRLIKNRGWTKTDIILRMNAQIDDQERCNLADYVVYNNSSLETFEFNFKKIINLIISSNKR